MQEIRRGTGKAARYFAGNKKTLPAVGSSRKTGVPIASIQASSSSPKTRHSGSDSLANDDLIDVTPIIKAFKARATAASTLWARENAELIRRHRKDQTIGNYKHTVRKLFKNLSKDEQAKWKGRRDELKASKQALNSDDCYEYVLTTFD